MKRITLTVLTALMVLLLATPVLAQGTEHTCPHGGATIADLRACLEHAVTMGHIENQGIARSLFAKLDAAQAALDRGQPEVAITHLEALINALGAQAGKHIAEEHAAHMIEHTQHAIEALG